MPEPRSSSGHRAHLTDLLDRVTGAEPPPDELERVPLRSTSIRLRRRRDQAKREFLVNRRSGDFGYNSGGQFQGDRQYNGGDWVDWGNGHDILR